MKNLEPIFSASNLSIGFKQDRQRIQVLSGLNFSFYQGECICLMGENGSGKSTLIKTLAALIRPLDGDVLLNGKPLSKFSTQTLSRFISVVLTEKPFIENFKVHETVALGRFPYTNWLGKLDEEDERVIEEALALTGLTKLKEKNIGEVSDGERQKVMIARALAQQTPVILLDEPTTHLDLPSRIEIVSLLRSLCDKHGKTIVFSCHELDLALHSATKCMLVGSTVHYGLPEELILNGHISKAFDRNDIEFSLSKGYFVKKSAPKGYFYINGVEIPAKWTQNALEREGFQYLEDASVRVNCEQNKWRVFYDGGHADFTNLSDLLDHVKSLNL